MTPTPSSLLQELVSGGSSPWGRRTEWLGQVDDVSPLARGVGGHPCARALPHVDYMPWTYAHPNGSRGVRLCCTKEGVGGRERDRTTERGTQDGVEDLRQGVVIVFPCRRRARGGYGTTMTPTLSSLLQVLVSGGSSPWGQENRVVAYCG